MTKLSIHRAPERALQQVQRISNIKMLVELFNGYPKFPDVRAVIQDKIAAQIDEQQEALDIIFVVDCLAQCKSPNDVTAMLGGLLTQLVVDVDLEDLELLVYEQREEFLEQKVLLDSELSVGELLCAELLRRYTDQVEEPGIQFFVDKTEALAESFLEHNDCLDLRIYLEDNLVRLLRELQGRDELMLEKAAQYYGQIIGSDFEAPAYELLKEFLQGALEAGIEDDELRNTVESFFEVPDFSDGW